MIESLLTHVVAGCVLRQDDRYLLVQEKKPSAYGLWNLPGGRVDEGESFGVAAIREALEETGFEVAIISKLPVEHNEPQLPVLHAFKAEITGGELRIPKDELLDAQWFSLDEIRSLNAAGKLRTEWVLRSVIASYHQ